MERGGRGRERKRKRWRTERGDCFIPLHSTCTVKMQSRHARWHIHHVCACTRGKRNVRGGVTAEGRHAGFVYPLARPCVISHGSILSTGTQFSRARCSFEFHFPAFARPSCTPISLFLPRPPPSLAFLSSSLSPSV